MLIRSINNMNNTLNRELLFQELNKAMDSNPDFSILDTLNYVLRLQSINDIKFNHIQNSRPSPKRKMNSDILKALERFNGRK
jgi:hypothetical protein